MTNRWVGIPLPPSYRGTTVQVCGLYPFAAGSSRPTTGIPIGPDLQTGTGVCCDAFSWFETGYISSASMMLFGLNGLGKSSFAVRQIIGLADRGICSMITDLKGEYVILVQRLGGQVMVFGGPGFRLNILDCGAMGAAADRIGGEKGAALRELAIDRAVNAVVTQIQIVRRAAVEDWEESLLSVAVRHLHERAQGSHEVPTLGELRRLLSQPTADMMHTAIVDNEDSYAALTKPLLRSVSAVLSGPLGKMYDGASTDPVRIDSTAVCIDISTVARQSDSVLASAMLAAWGETYGAIEAANALADAGLEPQRNFHTVLDEMWRAMRLPGAGLVDKADSITRLNRNDGTGHLYITHSLRDLESMDNAADNTKARGFAERSGIIVCAGLAKEDLRALSEVRQLSDTEIDTVSSWSTPPGWRTQRRVRSFDGSTRPAPPPGAGKVLIKLGERAGIQAQLKLRPIELSLHDTNSRWSDTSTQRGQLGQLEEADRTRAGV